MLGLSQTTGYAIKALACLNEPACRCRSTQDIAQCSGVPKPYLAKIISAMVRSRLVVSRRGIGGGVTLARAPEEISLLQIVEAVEGPDWLGDCLLGLDECTSQNTCPTHAFWERIRQEITHELRRTTLDAVITFQQQRKKRTPAPPERAKRQAPKSKNN